MSIRDQVAAAWSSRRSRRDDIPPSSTTGRPRLGPPYSTPPIVPIPDEVEFVDDGAAGEQAD